MSATACCTSKPIIYQIQVITSRSQYTPIVPRSTLSPSSSSPSIISISELRTPIKLNRAIKSNVNNNNNNNNHQSITTTAHHETSNVSNDSEIMDYIDEERYLAMVGLRSKRKKKSVPVSAARPLAKRLAAPICLLPLPKYGERVRQALNILLPFLKFLSITHDIDLYCSKEDHTKAENLLPRSATQTRAPKAMQNKINKRKVSKSEFITMATNTFRNNTRRTPMAKYIYSTIQCQVVLDRLDQSTIDQIIANSSTDNSSISQQQRSVHHQPIATTTTTTTPMTTVKHKSSTILSNDSKRFKTSHDNEKTIMSYQRIYLKCFVCSKRQYIDAQATNSDILHSHWREHGHDLLLNIYDSELDSVLTRIVEFFYFPRRHTLEGKIQTIFILNSKEIRKTSSKTVDDDSCIILD